MKYADSVHGHIALSLPKLDNGLGVFLADKGYTQLRIAETEKYAHVTFSSMVRLIMTVLKSLNLKVRVVS